MKYFITLLSICLLTACANKIESPSSTFIFSQSDYFLSQDCDENLQGEIWIKTANNNEADNVFKLFLNDQYIQDLQVSIKNKPTSSFALKRPKIYDFEIPRAALTKEQNNVLYVKYEQEQESHRSKEVLVHSFEQGSTIDYVKHQFEGKIGVKQYYWDQYEGSDIDANTKYIIHDENHMSTYEKEGVLYRDLSYKISLQNIETGQITPIKPNLKKTFTFDSRCNVKEGKRGFKSNRKDNLFGRTASISAIYDTHNTKDLSPGYQVYYHIPSVLIKGTLGSCHEIIVSSEDEILVPTKIVFKTFPTTDYIGLMEF